MNKKTWRQDLYKKYPMLFAQKNLDMKQTCMCWGIECNYGWSSILDTTCTNIMGYWEHHKTTDEYKEDLKNHDEDYGPYEPQFVQIKEKYGGLRLYINNGSDRIYKIIARAENASYLICEQCGTSINVTSEGSWILTLCNKCRRDMHKWTLKKWINQMPSRIKWWLKRKKRKWLSPKKN